MKRNILYLTAVALMCSSCSDFLNVQPEGDATTTNFFTNDFQAIDAVDGLYERFHQETLYGRELFWEQGAACDVVWGRNRSYPSLATFDYSGDESPLVDTYEALSKVVARSNWVIKMLNDRSQQRGLTAVETRSLGEAYFTRSWAHFLLAYRYGLQEQGVPFFRYENETGNVDLDKVVPPQQKSVLDNYKMIIEDLDSAIERLPRFEEYDIENRGRAHKAAAVAFKAKVYAYWAMWDKTQWNKVVAMVDELEQKYGRDLAPTYDMVFSSDFADYWNAEYLWTIPGTGGSEGGGTEFPGVILENKAWGLYNGWGQNKPSYDLYEEMLKDGAGNVRLVRTMLEYGQEFQFFGKTRKFYSTSDLEAGFMINKYMDPFKHEDATGRGYVNTNGNWPTARVNFPIIRFAEMLLFRAEAYLNLGQADKATKDLNRIRKRAGLADIAGTATMKDLYHERRCELAFEFTDHLFDLKRWHRSDNADLKTLAAAELNAHPRVRVYADRAKVDSPFTIQPYGANQGKKTYQDYMLVFPYPSLVVKNSGGLLKQNPNYN